MEDLSYTDSVCSSLEVVLPLPPAKNRGFFIGTELVL